LHKKLLHKSEFDQAHYEEWFKRSPTNLFYNFWTLLPVSTNFGNLEQFLEFIQLKNDLKITAQCRARIRPVATVRACGDLLRARLAGPRPGGPAQSRRRLTRAARAPAWSPRAIHACGGAVGAGQRQGAAGKHRWGPGVTPCKKSGAEAHRGGRAMVGWREAAGAAAFRWESGSGGVAASSERSCG
jgi:hypothetical protein